MQYLSYQQNKYIYNWKVIARMEIIDKIMKILILDTDNI